MEIRQLRYFIAVATHGSFTKASEKLYIAQPALSRHIQLLEEEFGVKLLVRTPRGVEPTEAGLRLREKAEFILSYMAEIKSSLSQASTEPSGQLVIGMAPSLAVLLAPWLIEESTRRYPRLKLRIMEGLSVFLAEWLDQARIDLAVLTDFGAIPGIELETVLEEELYFVGASCRLKHAGNTISTSEIENHPLIISHGFKMLAEAQFFDKDIEPNFVMELDSISIVKDMLYSGNYCSIMPYGMVFEDVERGNLRALHFEEPRITRRIVIGVKSNRPKSIALLAASNLIKERVATLPVGPPHLR